MVTKSFESQKALDAVSLNIQPHQFVALAGPDGAGKTTLLRMIAGLLKPTEGTLRVNGLDTIKEAQKLHQQIGYMPQRFGLYEDLTVQQNLSLYADLQSVGKEEKAPIFQKLLSMMNLSRFTERLAGDLSGGMKQKLGLACTLIRKPTLLLLDEPSVGVDPVSRRELWELMQQFLEEGITVIWSTSYLDEAEKADLALLLHEGKLLYQGAPQELTKRMEGKTFTLERTEERKRVLLSRLLNEPFISDGIIQGEKIRIVTKNNPPIQPLWTSCPPRFEDAFVDLLGGGPGGSSRLAEKTPQILTEQKNVIIAEHITKRFGSFTAVNDVSFQVAKGEVFGLLGPNGAGKSTTFKMLCGLLQPSSGKAFVNGLSLQTAPAEARSHIGYMAQKFSLYGGLSVKQNLDFFSGVYPLRNSSRRHAVEEMIEIFGFSPYLDQSASLLPLGYKQRLALACSTMHRPEVLFLDEPTSGVDPITRREFWNHINGLVEKGCTVLVSTHFMDEAEYCDRIALIYQSQMIHIDSPDALKKLAQTPENMSPTLEDAFITLIEQHDQRKKT
ncbi:MAG TPA: multidrug ABC transporter ATP-binding protein [Parachlamydiales bacterium]|nr:multidrug ABC transporter ATP-binding protein [Parachlamydiales bacterium]